MVRLSWREKKGLVVSVRRNVPKGRPVVVKNSFANVKKHVRKVGGKRRKRALEHRSEKLGQA